MFGEAKRLAKVKIAAWFCAGSLAACGGDAFDGFADDQRTVPGDSGRGRSPDDANVVDALPPMLDGSRPWDAGSTLHPRLSDNFESGIASGWRTYGGTWAVANGRYGVAPAAGAKSIVEPTSFTDFSYEADVWVGPTGNAGLIFRVAKPAVGVDAYVGYYVGISAATRKVEIGRVDRNWNSLGTADIDVASSTRCHIMVVAAGQSLQVFVNTMAVPQVVIIDGTYPSGAIGLRTFNADAWFDNIEVTGF